MGIKYLSSENVVIHPENCKQEIIVALFNKPDGEEYLLPNVCNRGIKQM